MRREKRFLIFKGLQKLTLISLMVMAFGAMGAEYMYRDLLANTLPSQKCAARAEAEQKVQDTYHVEKHAKTFCETQGYGWHVSEVKDKGKLVCNECDTKTGNYQCNLEDVRVTCKRLKPGSVGLFPGEG